MLHFSPRWYFNHSPRWLLAIAIIDITALLPRVFLHLSVKYVLNGDEGCRNMLVLSNNVRCDTEWPKYIVALEYELTQAFDPYLQAAVAITQYIKYLLFLQFINDRKFHMVILSLYGTT